MKELLGRLTALDPEASETLKVVSYFDALVERGVGPESLLRSAAALTAVPCGLRVRDRYTRVEPDGQRRDPSTSPDLVWPTRDAGNDSVVWMERTGTPHANDAMVLERLVIALAITAARRTPDSAGSIEIALSTHATEEERSSALARLRLDAEAQVRAVALEPHATYTSPSPSSIVVTPRGLARAIVCPAGEPLESGSRMGLGLPVEPERLAESWASALIALRLATREVRVVDASDLGAILLLAQAADANSAMHPDAAALAALDARALALMDAFVEHGSVRAAAAAVGVHHSSAQERFAGLATAVGYDVRTATGRTRYALARVLAALTRPGL